MMVAQYSCSVDVEVPKNKKIMQWAGIFAILFSLGFIMLSVFYSWYFMIAFAFFFAGGVVNLHFYNDVKRSICTNCPKLGLQSLERTS